MSTAGDERRGPSRAYWRAGVALILLAVLVVLPYLAARWRDEARTHRHVALAVDLEEWADVARAYGANLRFLLGEIRARGVNLASIKEAKVGRLEFEGRLAIHDPSLGLPAPLGLPFVVRPGRVYLRLDDPALFDIVASSLPARLEPGGVAVARPWIEVASDAKNLREVRTGFSPADLELAADLGYGLLLRPESTASFDPASRLPAASPGSVVLFQGPEVLGAPDRVALTAETMNARGLVLGLLETAVQLGLYDQLGLRELAEGVGFRAVRVHTFGQDELRKLTAADLVDRSLRAVRDRGIGVLYLKVVPPVPGEPVSAAVVAKAMAYYGGLVEELRREGYAIDASRPAAVPEQRLAAWPGLLGTLGGLAVLLGAMLDQLRLGRRSGLLGAAVLAAVPLLAVLARLAGGEELMLESTAFAVAAVLPAAAVAVALRVVCGDGAAGDPEAGGWRIPWARGLGALCAATAIGLAGGLLVAATLGGPYYVLEFGYFRGVKLAHLIPPAIAFCLGALAVWRARGAGRQTLGEIKGWLGSVARSPLTWGATAVLGVAVVGLMLVLGRSGHTAGFGVSAFEVALRDLFDVILFARPRFKEVLLGHPALLAVAWLGIRPGGRWGWAFAAGLGAVALGQVSVVNSFAHIRTPIVISLVRSLNGLWMGLLVGLGLIGGLRLLVAAWRWLERDA